MTMKSLMTPIAGAVLALMLPASVGAQTTGNVVFFHPDGTGVNHWTAARMHVVGPDGTLNWDRLPEIGVYKGHMSDNLTSTSHGGATTHAYGVKVKADSYGKDGKETLTAASGRQLSIAEEAMEAGKSVALVQTGHLAEPGTGAFVASVDDRDMKFEIAQQVIESGARVIMGGGERYLLPKGVDGRHGPGMRSDGVNLIERAKKMGYTVVYTREEMMSVDTNSVDKLLGVFAHDDTYNDQPHERNVIEGKPHYVESAPTIAEMAEVSLSIVSRDEDGFFAVVEEEATDNFPGYTNAAGHLEALKRADKAAGVLLDFIEGNPDTLVLNTADSDASGVQVFTDEDGLTDDGYVKATTDEGGVLKGQQGALGEVFLAAPNAQGERLPYALAFTGGSDVAGGQLVRAAGFNSELVQPLMDNSDMYSIMYQTLFGREPSGDVRE